MFAITELQLDILRVLWARGEGSVAEVHEALSADRSLATTTVATLLTRLEKRGLVTHRTQSRRHIYRPSVTEDQVRTDLLETVTDTVFEGDVTALVAHLLGSQDVSRGDLDKVQDLLDRMTATDEEPDDVR